MINAKFVAVTPQLDNESSLFVKWWRGCWYVILNTAYQCISVRHLRLLRDNANSPIRR